MSLLQNLYKEYKELNVKLEKVKDLILAYGGTIPEDYEPVIKHDNQSITTHLNYSSLKGWKDKIVHILALYDRPLTVGEIAGYLKDLEPNKTDKQLSTTISQYCSNLSKGEDAILIAESDSSGYRNTYKLK